jgi:hypothetical protein
MVMRVLALKQICSPWCSLNEGQEADIDIPEEVAIAWKALGAIETAAVKVPASYEKELEKQRKAHLEIREKMQALRLEKRKLAQEKRALKIESKKKKVEEVEEVEQEQSPE